MLICNYSPRRKYSALTDAKTGTSSRVSAMANAHDSLNLKHDRQPIDTSLKSVGSPCWSSRCTTFPIDRVLNPVSQQPHIHRRVIPCSTELHRQRTTTPRSRSQIAEILYRRHANYIQVNEQGLTRQNPGSTTSPARSRNASHSTHGKWTNSSLITPTDKKEK